VRSFRSPNDAIERQNDDRREDSGRRCALRRLLAFIIAFTVVLVVSSGVNILLGMSAWEPYPLILLSLFLSMLGQ
jgi:uncharacterized membrane protein